MGRKKRSYGFGSKKQKNKKPEDKVQKQQPFSNTWISLPVKIIGFVFVLIYKIIKYLLTAVGFLWKKRPKPSKNIKNKFKKIIGWGLVTVVVFGFLSATIIAAWANKNLPSPDQLTQREVAQSTKIYDRTGEHLLYEIYGDQNRTLVKLEKIPDSLKNAVIATEDTEFYNHWGIRPLSILRAVVDSILTGEKIEGTSTLTQQLVKNAVLTRERTLIRKIKEAILAIKLEQQYDKDQILQIYFNEIPYGSTNYGVESATQSYFGKSVKEINLEQAATLAGLPKAPTNYLNNRNLLKQRRNFVLSRMYEEGFISKKKMKETQNKPLSLSRKYKDIKAPHFVLHVREKLVNKFGERKVDRGGLKVITTLDWKKQKLAKKIVSSTGKKVLKKAEGNNTAMIALNPNNSQILAMIGSKNFNNNKIDGKFNVATKGKRQPGSSFKPIIYTAAFEKGYTPQTLLYDVKTDFAAKKDESYEPKNYDLKERGPVTMRKALQGSINIPAVKTLYLVGERKGVEFAERFGYSTLSRGNFGLSLVLGGGEVIPLEHTNAYATLANDGVYRKPTSILRVEGPRGKILLESKKKEGKKVVDSKYTKLITDVLSDNKARAFAFGEDNVLNLKDRPVAAKTGTTNNYVDSWTLGYTPNLVVGVWAGNTDNSPMKKGFGGSKVAGPIWHEFMKKALKDETKEKFTEPPKIKTDKPILNGKGGKLILKINKNTGLIATSSTPQHVIEKKTYVPPHSILHYVDKDNPRGPRPEKPQKDPQYKIWEKAIKDWKKRMNKKKPEWNISFKKPPSKKDTGYSPELVPTVEVLSPKPSSTLVSRKIDINIQASAPRGVKKVIYKLDGKYISVQRNYPFNLDYHGKNLSNGKHTLTIIAQDDIGNRKVKTVPFLLKAGKAQPSISWIKITRTLKKEDFPLTLLFRPFEERRIDKIDIFAKKDGAENKKITTITKIEEQFSDNIRFKWNNYPGAGEWVLRPKIITTSGQVIEGEKMMLEVK